MSSAGSKRLSRVEALFTGHRENCERIRADKERPWLLHRAESLLERADAAGVRGAAKLAVDAGSASKFENLLAELAFGVMVVR